MTALGIDFGTTNSVLAGWSGGGVEVHAIDDPPLDWARLGFDRVLPSVLGVDGDERATFGWRAKQQTGLKLEAVKRLFAVEDMVHIGGMTFSVEMAAALLFARIKIGAENVGVQMDHAVVTIPANSRGLARFRTKLCAGLAGIDVRALINEPTAAAMAHSIDMNDDQTILVFDWGGGTLDVTVLETVAGVFIERASKGIQRLGGIDFDSAFAAAVLEQLPDSASWSDAERGAFRLDIEKAKVILSEQTETSLPVPGGSFHPVTRSLLEKAIAEKIEWARRPIDQCLQDLQVAPSAIDHVVMVGGTSKIPLVRQFVSDLLGKEPAEGCDPMTAVAEGAAIAAAILSGQLDNDFFVSTEHALGTITVDDFGRAGFSTLIPRNHTLPAREKGSYVPAREGQDSVLVRVIEGDPDVPVDHPDNVVLREWEIPVDATRPREQAGFDIAYEYDVDGILHVTVVDQLTEAVMLKDDLSFGVSRDKAGLVSIARAVEATMSSGSLGAAATAGAPTGNGHRAAVDPAVSAMLDRVRNKVVPFVPDDEGQRLADLACALEAAGPSSQAECRERLEVELRRYAYLF